MPYRPRDHDAAEPPSEEELSWGEIAELATNDKRSATQTLAAAEREEPADHLDKRHAYFALRYIAQRSGIAAPVRDQYAAERAKVLAAARRRKDGDLLAPLLPTVGQIERLFDGDWDAALVYADLERAKPKPVPPPRTAGMPLAEATAHFVRENGWWPTQAALRHFYREAGVRMQSTTRAEPITTIRTVATALLASEGVPVPTEAGPPADAKSRPIKVPAGGIPGAVPREAEPRWSEAACIEAVAGCCASCRAVRRPPRLPTSPSNAASRSTRRLSLRRARRIRRDQAQSSGPTPKTSRSEGARNR